jgi:uncharacterized coiled-coil DUF342 family protein
LFLKLSQYEDLEKKIKRLQYKKSNPQLEESEKKILENRIKDLQKKLDTYEANKKNFDKQY